MTKNDRAVAGMLIVILVMMGAFNLYRLYGFLRDKLSGSVIRRNSVGSGRDPRYGGSQ